MWKSTLARTIVASVVGLWLGGPVSASVLFSEDFEDGEADGFSLEELWHVTDNFPAGGTYALGYVQNESTGNTPDGDYDIGNVAATSFSPPIAIPDGVTTLVFDAFVGDEYDGFPESFDQFNVWASLDGSSLDTLLASSPPSLGGVLIQEWGGPGTEAYQTIAAELSPFAGKTIYLAYQFDPLDDLFNEYPGVRVDNITVEHEDDARGQSPVVPEPASLLLFGLGAIGASLSRRRFLA